jgi:GNAT superfamily N-acetyltransferase
MALAEATSLAAQPCRPGRWQADIGHHIIINDAYLPEEYLEILALRVKGHRHHGRHTNLVAADLASTFDSHSRHLVCRHTGRIIGYVRLTHVDGSAEKSQYVTLGGHNVPSWLWKAGFIEGGAGAIDPEFQLSGLWILLMQHAVEASRRMGHRYMLGGCEDGLLPVYKGMGFTHLESRDVEPVPGWKFHSHLIVMDFEELLRRPPIGKWVSIMADAVSSADAAASRTPTYTGSC